MKEIVTKKELVAIEDKMRRALTFIGDDILIPSNVLCEIFGIKKHSTVVNRIEKELSDLKEVFGVHEHGHEIIQSTYSKRGKKEKNYLLSSEGFMQVGLSFRTSNAVVYRRIITKILHESIKVVIKNKLTAELNSNNPDWLPYRIDSKQKRLSLTDAINRTVMIQRAEEGKQGDGWYFKTYTNFIYKILGVLPPPLGVHYRDIATPKQLKELEEMEDKVSKMIIDSDEYYKDTYQTIKKELLKQ